mmetsp:Transcript_7563/g.23293  ORF Transcript_7563/g.23293 Transcript_7563/m.23293 type:complete len:378 (+) Transcript_7563:83-1216(+)
MEFLRPCYPLLFHVLRLFLHALLVVLKQFLRLLLVPTMLRRRFFSKPYESSRVLVVGGGFAGTAVCKRLQSSFNTTLLTNETYFEFSPSILRATVEPEHFQHIQISYADLLDDTSVVTGLALDIDPVRKQVATTVGAVPYDYLVVCTGSSSRPPHACRNAIPAYDGANLQPSYAQLMDVNCASVVIIGGGVVGVELAAELLETFPTKRVSIITSAETLLTRSPPGVVRYCLRFLEQFSDRFALYLNCKVKSVKGNVYETTNGDQVVGDMAYFCTGIQPNVSVFRSHFEDSIKVGGWVSVRPSLQLDTIVENSSVVFVAGDLIDVHEEKLAQTAQVRTDKKEMPHTGYADTGYAAYIWRREFVRMLTSSRDFDLFSVA